MAVAATVAIGANNGTGSPTATLNNTGDDSRGTITLFMGTGPAAGSIAILSFGGSWTGYASTGGGGPFVTLTAQGTNLVGGVLGTLTAAVNATFSAMTIYCTGTPVAAATYVITYKVDP